MSFKNYLQTTAVDIENKINSYKSNWQLEIEAVSPKLVDLIDVFTTAWEGGKRLRGSLVKLGYEMSGGQPNTSINEVAVAYEIFQTSILAHDDIIDLSPTRRGKPTVYRQLGGDHYGISQTICLGDIGFFLANKLIVDSNFDSDLKVKALHYFSRMVINTGLGEMLDIELPHLKQERSEDDVIIINRLKTADYTISYPLMIGAILGGASDEKLAKITQFGTDLGIAFQIQDDILGIFGDEQTIGKSVTSDIEEGKNTLLITQAYKNANTHQKEILDKYYGKADVTSSEIEQIKQIFLETESVQYSKDKAQEYVSSAKKIITELTDIEEYQQLLSEMAEFLVSRDK